MRIAGIHTCGILHLDNLETLSVNYLLENAQHRILKGIYYNLWQEHAVGLGGIDNMNNYHLHYRTFGEGFMFMSSLQGLLVGIGLINCFELD